MTMDRLRPRAGDDAGITLVEMMVALLVMAIVFAALGGFLITSIAAQTGNERRAQAVQLAQQSLEAGRALPWELTGFYADDTQAASCGSTGGPVVALAAPAAPAPKSIRVPKAGPQTITTSNGIAYTQTTCYRWIDDAGDNNSSGVDADGNKQDVKRIETAITWSVKGEAKSYTSFALRAPTAAEVKPKTPGSSTPFGITSVTPGPAAASSAPIDAAGKLTAPLTFTATTTTGVSVVQLRWTDAAGAARFVGLASGGSTTSWTVTLPVGTGPFAPVLTTFAFAANSPTGEVSNQTTTVSFSSTPGALTIAELKATPNSIDVSSAGLTATAVLVQARTNSDVTSATLRYRNRAGSDVTLAMALDSARQASYTFPVGSGPFADGVTAMAVSVNGLGGTATSSTNVTFVPPAIPKVELLAATTSPSLCVSNNDGRVLRTTTFTVEVQGVVKGDDVTLQLNDVAGTRVPALHQTQSGTTATFAYSLTTSSAFSWKNKNQLSVAVLATRRSDNTQATNRYDSSLFDKNGGSECPIS